MLNIAAAKLARRAVDAHSSAAEKKAIVAGLIEPTSELFQPLGQLSHAGALAGFKEQADALAEGRIYVLWI